MSAITAVKTHTLALLLMIVVLVSGCGIASSYRPAYQKTIRDFSGNGSYRKTVGVMALSNTTQFANAPAASPLMTAFLSSIGSAAADALLVVPGKTDVPSFLWSPPRLASGELDVFTLSALARQEGMNVIASPVLMDIRVRTRDSGFWIFKDVAYSLQIQTAAALYDAITGSRLALEILIDEVDIDADQAAAIRNGREPLVDDLAEVAAEMGEKLGERMGDAVEESKWLASVISVENGICVIAAGGEAGIEVGDRFSVLDGSGVLAGLDGQRFVAPGPKIGEIAITQVASRQSYGAPESGDMPPAGSILIPGR
jgi:hypothetical protein